jgi:hypothetical protein
MRARRILGLDAFFRDTLMDRKHTALWIAALALFATLGMAADDSQAERESRRIEVEARRQQEMARRDMAERERSQAEALRAQEEAIRRLEATRGRIADTTQQIAQESVDQARSTYPYRTASPQLPPRAAAGGIDPGSRADIQRYDDPLGGMSLAPLSERLGSYFGTQEGVLVVRAGTDAPFGLQDGDVILSVDGRTPINEQHAVGIFRSYRPGEKVKLRIQRDRRAINLDTRAPGKSGE